MKLANLLLLLPTIFTDISSAQNAFEAGMSYAKSPERQNIHTKALEVFKEDQQKSLKSTQGEHTENPPQTAYYSQDHGSMYKLKQDSLIETTKDENTLDANGNPVPTPGKVITTAFVSRPVFQITGKEEFMQKGKIATDNAENIITGESNKHINCQNQRMSACKIVNVEKNCNEAKLLHKVCEKIPEINTATKKIIYPGCNKVVVTQAVWNHCPAGYRQIAYSDMIRPDTHDDIRICLKDAAAEENTECYGGHLIHGLSLNGDGDIKSTQRVTVPKNMNSRIRFSNLFSPHMTITVINETTGEVVYNQNHFTDGQVAPLPFSTDKDQTFRFHDHGGPLNCFMGRCSDWKRCCGKGVMILYIDHINSEKFATVTWKDLPCHYE